MVHAESRFEKFIVFIFVMLQYDSMMRRRSDIKSLFQRRPDMWKQDQVDEIMFEFLQQLQ